MDKSRSAVESGSTEIFLLGRPPASGADHEVKKFTLTEENWERTLDQARAYAYRHWGRDPAEQSVRAVAEHYKDGVERARYDVQALARHTMMQAAAGHHANGGADPFEVFQRKVIPAQDGDLYRRRVRDNLPAIEWAMTRTEERFENAARRYVQAIHEGTEADYREAVRSLHGREGLGTLHEVNQQTWFSRVQPFAQMEGEALVHDGKLIDPVERSVVRRAVVELRKRGQHDAADVLDKQPVTQPSEQVRDSLMRERGIFHSYVLAATVARSKAANFLTKWRERRKLEQPHRPVEELSFGVPARAGNPPRFMAREQLARYRPGSPSRTNGR